MAFIDGGSRSVCGLSMRYRTLPNNIPRTAVWLGSIQRGEFTRTDAQQFVTTPEITPPHRYVIFRHFATRDWLTVGITGHLPCETAVRTTPATVRLTRYGASISVSSLCHPVAARETRPGHKGTQHRYGADPTDVSCGGHARVGLDKRAHSAVASTPTQTA